jgi:hypothetical protein
MSENKYLKTRVTMMVLQQVAPLGPWNNHPYGKRSSPNNTHSRHNSRNTSKVTSPEMPSSMIEEQLPLDSLVT